MLDFIILLSLATIIILLVRFVIRVLAKFLRNSPKSIELIPMRKSNDFVFRDHIEFLLLFPFSLFLILLSDMWAEIKPQPVHFLSVATLLISAFICYRLIYPVLEQKDKEFEND